MSRDEQIELLKRDVAEWNAWRASKNPPPIDLAGSDLRRVDLSNADLTGAKLTGADLCVAKLIGAKLTGADFSGAKLIGVKLTGADLRGVDLSEANLNTARLNGANLSGANLSGAKLSLASVAGADLSGANLSGANLCPANLSGAKLNNANLESSDLSAATLHDTQFHKANLSRAIVAGAKVNYMTSFHGAKVTGCRIQRHTLESLEEYGGLTPGDRMNMTIVDGVATLRSAYSGFQQWMHLTALVAFLAPYVYFVTVSLIREHFQLAPGAPQAQLRIALARFIWNGGQQLDGWHLAALSMTWFLYSLFYNILRGFLLWKTKKLELHEQASGLPAPFSLSGWWKHLYLAATWGFWINLAVVAAHTWHFLGTWVPLPT